VTGFYGLLTVRLVRRFQVAHGIRTYDGPSPVWTPRVLDPLARYRARATFFVVGRSAAPAPG
jgi:peptidoglycan/xylan/chitin deacetylase (PgdA/CDA1 family)